MIKTEIIEKLSELELAEANTKHPPKFANWHEAYAVTKEELEEAEDEIIQARCHLNSAWESIKEDDEVETREEFKLLKESGISAIQELVQLVAMCNKAIDSLEFYTPRFSEGNKTEEIN